MKWLPILLMTALSLIACNREEGSGNDNAEETNAPSSSDREKAATELQQAWAQSRPDQGRSQQRPQGGPDPVPAPSDVASPPGDARRTDSGLAYKVLKTGDGQEHPGARDEVTVHYTGWTTDGNMFDSSVTRGQPATFPLNRVIGGWTEGVQLMVTGEKTRFWIPEELAYGGRPGRPAGMLVFDIELISIKRAPQAPETPSDVREPPANSEQKEVRRQNAEGTAVSGTLYSRVLEPGTGTKHPAESSTVEVHYTGWTTDGNMFDSSVTRGRPARFPLGRVIPGWTEGVQLMVEGEKRRFWIPESLAYAGRPGAPAGMLVFDVQLLRILD